MTPWLLLLACGTPTPESLEGTTERTREERRARRADRADDVERPDRERAKAERTKVDRPKADARRKRPDGRERRDDKDPDAADSADDPAILRAEQRALANIELAVPEGRAALAAGPDLLFITWDTIRADHVSGYGYPRRTTPELDALMESAVVFERFIVPMATTLPSHTSMFTGVQPEEHGILANATVNGEILVPSERLVPIAAHLSDQGYVTAGAVSSAPVKKHSGIAAGFSGWNQPVSHHRRARETTDAALAFAEQAPADAPLFLWVHYYDPHAPYSPPAGLKKIPTADPKRRSLLKSRRHNAGDQPHAETLDRLRRYDHDILYTDRETARLVEGWKATRAWDRTVVVFAGDHGEGLGQHGHLEHGLTWDEQLHAPFFIRAPGLEARRIPYPVGAHDILPTVMGIVELPGRAAWLRQASGRDVLATGFEPTPVFSRMSLRQVGKDLEATFALTGERWKFILHESGKTELYELPEDPHETLDMSAYHPEVVATLTEQVHQMRKSQEQRAAALGPSRATQLDDAAIEELRQLGYME
jgi:arylsulfatase A-like enzyme